MGWVEGNFQLVGVVFTKYDLAVADSGVASQLCQKN